jgi:hypothetical protein
MLTDAQGLNVTTTSEQAIATLNAYTELYLSYSERSESSILLATVADSTCVLANTHAAAYYLAQENGLSRQQALPYL